MKNAGKRVKIENTHTSVLLNTCTEEPQYSSIVLYSNIRGLHTDFDELAVAGSDCDFFGSGWV